MPRERHSTKGLAKTWGASVDPEQEAELLEIVRKEKRSKAQIGGFLLGRGLSAYKRDGFLSEPDVGEMVQSLLPSLPINDQTMQKVRMSNEGKTTTESLKSPRVRRDVKAALAHVRKKKSGE